MNGFEQTLRQHLDQLAVVYDGEMIAAAAAYGAYLLEENAKVNLTAITDPSEVAVKHFADSLSLLKYVDLPKNASLLDLGSGAGFPGMALKLFRPDLKVTLADAAKKRCAFLERLGERLNIRDVSVVWGRAEDLGQMASYREQFDFVTARAVAALPLLLEYCLPLVRVDGAFLAMKAKEEPEAAKNALTVLGGELAAVHRYHLDQEERTVFVIKKRVATPEKYPRRAGIPEKRPL